MSLLPPLDNRGPVTLVSFIRDLLPSILLYYTTAVLVIIPNTIKIRVALLPVTLYCAFRTIFVLDFALGFDEPGLVYLNQGLVLAMTVLSMRVVLWTFRIAPLKRTRVNQGIEKESSNHQSTAQVALDAADLTFGLRGYGWNFSRGLIIPTEKRPTSPKSAFLKLTFASVVKHFLVFDFLHFAAQSYSPATIGSPTGGTIFNPNLSPILRYLAASSLSLISGLVVYCAIRTIYDISTIIGILVLRQDPSQWPPVFDHPWSSSSLIEFWSRRWHQLFRDCFLGIGAQPLSLVAGRIGGVIGAFTVSGIMHELGLWGMGNGGDFRQVAGFFLMMGVGVILESSWRKVTGQRVGGTLGRIWTAFWLIGWGTMLTDAWCRKGLVGSVFLADSVRPSQLVFNLTLSYL